MLPGIPLKKPLFKSFKGGQAISFRIKGNVLYALYSLNDDPSLGPASFLKCVDLSGFDGDFASQPNVYELQGTEAGLRSVNIVNDSVLIWGMEPEVLALDGGSIIYSECGGPLNPAWDGLGWVYYWAGYVYRGFGVHSPGKGVDVVHPVENRVVEHLDLDIVFPTACWQGSLLAGERLSGGFAVYCFDRRKYILDVTLEEYPRERPDRAVHSTIDDGLVYLLVDGWLLVFDIEAGQLLREIKYIDFPKLQAHLLAESLNPAWAFADGISVCEREVVLSHSLTGGYLLYIAPFRAESIIWFWSAGRGVAARNCFGDLVFGLSGTVPMAWDKFTGEVVWDAKKPTATGSILVGEQSVIFCQLSGYIQCHQWKKTYISPHRPVEE